MRYSIDNQTKRTILENATIPMVEKGIYTIQMFRNNAFRTISQLEIEYFTVNIKNNGNNGAKDVGGGNGGDANDAKKFNGYFIPILIISRLIGVSKFLRGFLYYNAKKYKIASENKPKKT